MSRKTDLRLSVSVWVFFGIILVILGVYLQSILPPTGVLFAAIGIVFVLTTPLVYGRIAKTVNRRADMREMLDEYQARKKP